jgi:hypothetical protein
MRDLHAINSKTPQKIIHKKSDQMKQLILSYLKNKYPLTLSFIAVVFLSMHGLAQKLEKMPVDLETDFALSSMPAHMRGSATVYLLDPDKGYYMGRQGTNGFVCFVARTDWEHGEYRNDFAAPISYDAEGAKTIWPSFADVEEMRASGKVTAVQLKDIMKERFSKGYYKAPSRPGISYMVAPIMRVYDGSSSTVLTMEFPHYMFYAPYISEADIGGNSSDGGPMILGDGKGPHGYIIIPAGAMEKARIEEDNKALLKRLTDYRSYFKAGSKGSHH